MEWTTVETVDGAKLSMRLFKPAASVEDAEDVAVVLVHPYTILGGVQGLLRDMAQGLAERATAPSPSTCAAPGAPPVALRSRAPVRSGTSSPSAAGSPTPSSHTSYSSLAPPP
ncbi:hypothetical protein CFC21_093404, partial [Triticum aestivum]